MSLDENCIISEAMKEDPVIEVPQIDFIIGDRPMILGNYVQMVKIQELKNQFIPEPIQSNSGHQGHQETWCLKPTWNERLTACSKSCDEYEDQEEYQEFVRLIFYLGGLL